MRDAAGALDRHEGSRTGAIAPSGPRPRIGTGYWQDDVLPPDDPTGDGRPDLIARDTAGGAFHNESNGRVGLGARGVLTTGWQGYDSPFRRGRGVERPGVDARTGSDQGFRHGPERGMRGRA